VALRIRRVSELRRKKRTHYEVMVKDGAGYFLCRGMDAFGRHLPVDHETEITCRLCRSLFRGRGLKEHGEL